MFHHPTHRPGLSAERLQQIRSAGLGAPRSIVEREGLSLLAWETIAVHMVATQRRAQQRSGG